MTSGAVTQSLPVGRVTDLRARADKAITECKAEFAARAKA